MSAHDPRLTPARPDLAAERLRGVVEAERFAVPVRRRVVRGVLPLWSRPGARGLAAELLFGAAFDVYEEAGGLAWGQAARDGYVGFAPAEGLGEPVAATHRVRARLSNLYPAADLKTKPLDVLSLGAELAGEVRDGWLIAPEGAVPAQHVAPVGEPEADWVEVAERFLGTPYVWGGNSGLGIDCSGLVQVARQAAGFDCPRDSDMQAGLGAAIAPGDLRRGDLVFWRGHVGVMLDGDRLLHANAHHMAAAVEPLREAAARIARAEGEPTGFRRLEG